MRLLWTATLLATSVSAQTWQDLGPAPISGPYTGRVAAVATSRDKSNADLWYIGGADGGVWKTTDAGVTWTPIGDHLPTTAVGALCVDPKNDQILYVGMGEANFANHSRYGLGLAKTVNGGKTWELYGRDTFAGRAFSRIAIDPGDSNVLYASITTAGGFPALSAARGHPGARGPLGLFQSTDAGKSWTQLGSGIPTNLSATDCAVEPTNGKIVYVAFGHIFGDSRNGIYKSTDAGKTFAKLTNGLPSSSVGRITIAIAPSRPSRLYASLVRVTSSTGGGASTLGVYRSDDAGASWTPTRSVSYQSSYGWYLCTSVVDPNNPDRVLIGGYQMLRSTNAGSSWITRTPPHVDLHALEYDAKGRLVCGDDGGVHVSGNHGDSWTSPSGFGLIQFYAGLSLHPTNATTIYGGTQDNGTNMRTSGRAWQHVLGGDGGYTAVDNTGTRVFAEYQGTGNLFVSVNNGSYRRSSSGISGRNCFLPPFEIDPSNALHMIYGTHRVFESTNGGSSWSAISNDLTGGGAIRGLAIARDGKTMYTISNDGLVYVTEDGRNWRRSRTGVPGWYRTTRPFAIDPNDPKRCWLAVGWFGVDQVLYTSDAGRTWTSLDGDLPDQPVHCVGIVTGQGKPYVLFAGAETGVWRTTDFGKTWELYGDGLPNAPVIDLRVDEPRKRIVVGTQGRGAWQVDLLPRDEQGPKPVIK